MTKVFLDEEHERFFKKNGYIKLCFDQTNEIENFKERIYALTPSDHFQAHQKTRIHEMDFHCTFFDSNLDYRNEVFNTVTSLFEPVAKKLLSDFKFIQANVFIKPPHKGYLAPHQNLTVVDETRYTSLSFWCPALDTDRENGTITLVPGSHKKFMKYRSTNISWPLLPLFKDYTSSHFETINVKKGEFLILDDSIIHGTTINSTAEARFVFHALLVPKQADVLFCEINMEMKKVKLFKTPPLFWQNYIPGSVPNDLTLIEEREYNEEAMTEAEFSTTLYANKDL